MERKNWLSTIIVFLLWLLVVALGAWVVIVVRHGLLAGLAVFYVGDSLPRSWQVRFVDRAYVVITGLIYLVFIFVIQGYLEDGAPARDLFRRFARTVGVEAMLLFVADLFTSFIQKSLLGRISRILVIVELVVGGALLAYSFLVKPRRPKRHVE